MTEEQNKRKIIYSIRNNCLYMKHIKFFEEVVEEKTTGEQKRYIQYYNEYEEKIWDENTYKQCPKKMFYGKLLKPKEKIIGKDTWKQQITNIYFGLNKSCKTIAGACAVSEVTLEEITTNGNGYSINDVNHTKDGKIEPNRYVQYKNNKSDSLPSGSRLLFRNKNLENGALQKIEQIITAFPETINGKTIYCLYYFDERKYKNSETKLEEEVWHKLSLPVFVPISGETVEFAVPEITEENYNKIYNNTDSDVVSDEVQVNQSIYNVDKDQNGFLIDYEALNEGNPEGEAQYLHNNGVSNEKVYFVNLEKFNYVPWKLKDASASVYNWRKKFQNDNSKKENVYDNIYILFDGVDNVSPLYSPELLDKVGLAYIRSDWLSFDENNNLVVKWWPERSLANLIQEEDCKLDKYKDYVKVTDLMEYSEANPLIGTICSFRTSDYLIGDKIAEKHTNFNDFTKDNYTLVSRKENSGSTEKAYYNKLVVMPVLNSSWKETDSIDKKWYCALVELIQLTEYETGKENIYIRSNEPAITQLAYWKYEEVGKQNVLYYFSDAKQTSPTGEVNLSYSVNDYLNAEMLKHPDSSDGYVLQNRYYVFYQFTSDIINKNYNNVAGYEIYVNTKVGLPVTWKDTEGKIVYSSLRVAEQDESNAEDYLNEAIEKNKGIWKTPSEFYNESNSEQNFEESDSGYIKSDVNENNSKYVNWWWCNTLRNWCIFLYTSKHKLNLYVWNGRNGWDNFEEIAENVRYKCSRVLKQQYFYNPEIFEFGVSYSEYTYRTKDFSKGKIIYNILKLTRDSKMSTYDENSFQNVHSTKHSFNDAGNGYFPANTQGCPAILRLSSHELGICYRLTARGRTEAQDMIREDSLSFVNGVCVAYFGAGSDKTIEKDWKKNPINWNEEKAELIKSADEEGFLIGCEYINTSIKNGDELSISFSVPRPNVISQDKTNDDYALRWE